jgi:ABC-type branched-subunit amino acid transport system substrate-binding protein
LSYLESNKPEEAREIIKSIIESASDEEWKVKAQEVMQRIDYGPKVTPNSIGCLLPLSGPFAMYGEEVLRGIELGFDIFQERDATLESMELIIRDTAGDPGKGVEIIEEFTEQQKTFVTIGPLVTKVAEGAVQKAQEAGMPIITFSQSEDITSKGEMVFQNCLTPEDQLRSLLNKVVYEMGLARFAILYPDNSYGRYFMNKFWGEAEFRGGIITAVESYNPQDTDFAVQIKKMAGLFYPRPEPDIEEIEVSEAPEKVLEEPEEALEGEGEDEKEPEPIIDFDAVFIPDSHERVALIAPQLAYHDVVGVTLLGTNLWNSPELIGIAGKYVNGAIFPADFFYGSGYIGVDDFVEKYKSIFGRNPGFLAAVGYDTIRIIKEILKEKDRTIKTREDFRLSLTEERNYNSVTGPMFFDHQRRATRDPLLLTVRGRHFLPLP